MHGIDPTPEEKKRPVAEFTQEAFSKSEYWAGLAESRLAKAECLYEDLKKLGEVKLQQLKQSIAISESERRISDAELTRLAMTTKEWVDHNNGLRVALCDYIQAKATQRIAQRFYECIQSGLAYRRAEMGRSIDGKR